MHRVDRGSGDCLKANNMPRLAIFPAKQTRAKQQGSVSDPTLFLSLDPGGPDLFQRSLYFTRRSAERILPDRFARESGRSLPRDW
jgi:hypothetical protein